MEVIALQVISRGVHQVSILVRREGAGSREEVVGADSRVCLLVHDEKAVADDGDIGRGRGRLKQTLALDGEMKLLAERFADKHHALFLGRGIMHPIAMEGALKLKEISYIHAEAYPAGELKHGPLALVDADMPVIAVAPNNRYCGARPWSIGCFGSTAVDAIRGAGRLGAPRIFHIVYNGIIQSNSNDGRVICLFVVVEHQWPVGGDVVLHR